MKKSEYIAIIVRSLFEVNNDVRERGGLHPLKWERDADQAFSWAIRPDLRDAITRHAEGIYSELRPFLEDV